MLCPRGVTTRWRLHLMQGQQSDREYATVLARSKWRQSRWAPSRIRMVRLTPHARRCQAVRQRCSKCNLHASVCLMQPLLCFCVHWQFCLLQSTVPWHAFPHEGRDPVSHTFRTTLLCSAGLVDSTTILCVYRCILVAA